MYEDHKELDPSLEYSAGKTAYVSPKNPLATVGLVDLDSSIKANKPTIGIEVQRDSASDLGLGVGPLASALRILVAGQTVGNWRAADDQTYDVNVRLDPEARNSPQDLARLPFALSNAADGSTRIVRLNQVAQVVDAYNAAKVKEGVVPKPLPAK
jgi:HAE1 family hydrophobic/amphiphilic exporter-1